jgi:hypothetical protein
MRHRFCTPADEVLLDGFRLAAWVRRSRGNYFALCDDVSPRLAWLVDRDTPTPQSLLILVTAGLHDDATFIQAVRKRRSTLLGDEASWDRLRRAGAARIVDEYFDAIENGTWP